MEQKRFIFDLDGTLLQADFSYEKYYFDRIYGNDSYRLLENLGSYLNEYENLYIRYHKTLLSRFLTEKTGLVISEKIIDGWIKYNSTIPDRMEDGVIDTLEYLKSQKHSLGVLTNWFRFAQIERLKNSGLYDYFDDIYTGDFFLKPYPAAYFRAIGNFSSKNCVVVGDNLEKDYIGPRRCGLDSILYDKNDQYSVIVKVKKIYELINRY